MKQIIKTGYRLEQVYPGLHEHIKFGDIFCKSFEGDLYTKIAPSADKIVFFNDIHLNIDPEEYPEFFRKVSLTINIRYD